VAGVEDKVEKYTIVSNNQDGYLIEIKTDQATIRPQFYSFESKFEAEMWIAEEEAYKQGQSERLVG
jgi:hypothetical protein